MIRLPTEKMWREDVQAMRDVLQGDDVTAAREVLKELLGPIRLSPGENHLVAELTARQVMLNTGTGRWIGSGGRI